MPKNFFHTGRIKVMDALTKWEKLESEMNFNKLFLAMLKKTWY
jgi:uncharacterized protein (DUF1919 family)